MPEPMTPPYERPVALGPEPVARLRAFLDLLDEETKLPGEKPLRQVVAEQARERLAELDARQSDDPAQVSSDG